MLGVRTQHQSRRKQVDKGETGRELVPGLQDFMSLAFVLATLQLCLTLKLYLQGEGGAGYFPKQCQALGQHGVLLISQVALVASSQARVPVMALLTLGGGLAKP